MLARWSGWGAVPQLFDEHLDAFATQRAQLRDLLTEQEYAAARRSTINAHYTDAALVSTIWDGLCRLGFAGGDVLEPGCGAGHFIGLAPDSARMLGVELEPVSAAVAAALYPQARIVAGSFAELDAADGSVDAVVGNVPFAKVSLHDPRHNRGNHSIHNHFIIKALHLIRPGGMVAVLTSRYSMDATDPAARQEMAQLADLVGALRLPTGALRRAAGTDAITDLLILRRREPDGSPLADATAWDRSLPAQIGQAGTSVQVNAYFLDHPDNVLGELTLGHGMYGSEDLKVVADLDGAPAAFAQAVQRITIEARERGLTLVPRPAGAASRPRPAAAVSIIDPRAAAFAGFLTARPDGTFTRRVLGEDQPYTPPAKQAGELRRLLGLRDTAMALINAEQASIDDTADIHRLRAELNSDYDAYAGAHGPVNRCTERRQLRQSWHVFAQWCDRNERTKLPATAQTVHDYLTDLRYRGLGQDHLQRHLDGIARAHATAYNRQVAKAIAALSAHGEADDRQAEFARHLARTDPDGLLHTVGLDNPSLPPDALAAGRQALAAAPATTSPDLDLDAVGLRTTVILRPPQGGFRDDPFANVVRALERFDPTTQTARKADIFAHRVINPPRTRLGASTPEEALSICLDTHSRVDLAEIARLLGLSDAHQARAALGELVYDDPDTGAPIWAREYLSGNVRQKLALARSAADADSRFAVNVAALQRVVPADLGPQDIEIRLGSWIGPTYVQQFLRGLLDDSAVTVEHVAGLWNVASKSQTHSVAATELWGAGGLNAYQLTERLLIGTEIRITRTVETVNAEGEPVEREVLDAQATEEAKDKAREIGDRFADWVWEDTTRARELVETYNNTFNAEIPPEFSGVELSLPGLSSTFRLREHQKTAVARIVYQPGTGLVHEVGAGKTLEMIVGVMERRRRGLATKPAVVVPNDSIAEQFEREWLQAYPSARLLTATSADLAAGQAGGRNKRAEFVARVATGDWDAVIMTKESFQRIPLHPEAQERFLSAELDSLRQAKEANLGSMSHTMTKRLETAMASAEERLKKRLAGIDRDVAGVTLRDSGIDFLVIDEAQNYKNGIVASLLPGLAIEGADRSIDLDMKLTWLTETHGTPRVVLATATPFTNTFSEVYLWLRRLGHAVPPFDVWARTYCTSESFMEMTPGGNLRAKSRMRRVINEPELWRSLRLTSDIKMKQDLNLPTPRLRGDQVEIITVPAPIQARIYTLDLARRERQLFGKSEKGRDNHLVIQHDGQLAALDVRTLGLRTDQPQKVDQLADDIHTEWHAARDTVYLREDGTEHPARGGLILVFCDESTPGKGWNFYAELKAQLVTRGMDERSIRFIHEATSPQRKADLLAACREGAVSVLLGSTMKMGAGINVQTRALGGYEVTGPWRPDIPAQARGRVDRQGNQNPDFFWKRVVTSPSMDAKKWEITAQKHGMFAPLYTSTPPSRTREVTDDQSVGLADVMAAATGDPRYREKAELDQEYKALHRQRSAHLRTQQSLKLQITSLQARIPELEAKAARQDDVAARRSDTRGDTFRITIDGRTYDKRPEAAQALKHFLIAQLGATPRTPTGRTITVGTVGGYQLNATLKPLSDHAILLDFPDAADSLCGLALDARQLPERHGLITRLENQLDAIVAAPASTRALIDSEQRNLTQAHSGVGAVFPHERRLAEVTHRRAELIAELSEASDPDLQLDPDSPEGRARAEHAAARQSERITLHNTAHDTAVSRGANSGTTAAAFAAWYVEIAAPVTAEQRPPADAAYAVWNDLGRPDAYGDGIAPPRPSALPAPAPRHDAPTAAPDTTRSLRHQLDSAAPAAVPVPAADTTAAATSHAAPDTRSGDRHPASVPSPAARPTPTAHDRPAAATLIIEHNHDGTLVHGSTREDTELHTLLRGCTFRYSSRLNAWYLGRRLRYDTRSAQVRRLRTALQQAGRAAELREPQPAADQPPAPPEAAPAAGSQDHRAPQRRSEHWYAEVNTAAARWFDQQLDTSVAAQQYLRERLGAPQQLDQLRRRGFSIGYAPDQWTGLIDHLRRTGFQDTDLVGAGVASVDRRGQLIDRFRNRIMFGIRGPDGQLAGFIGRTRSTSENAKYLNTPLTPLFDKSTLLFGLYEQRDQAAHADPVFVEGPFDVLALAAHDPHQRLLPVGTCGTALTTHHLDAVDALVPTDRRRVIAFDGDTAGQHAALATAQDAIRRYTTLDLTTLPDGLDPAAWAQTAPAGDLLAAYLGAPHTRPALDTLIDTRLASWADKLHWVEGRIGAARDIARLLATIDIDRAAAIAVPTARRLDLDPTQLAEFIADARHTQGHQPPTPHTVRPATPSTAPDTTATSVPADTVPDPAPPPAPVDHPDQAPGAASNPEPDDRDTTSAPARRRTTGPEQQSHRTGSAEPGRAGEQLGLWDHEIPEPAQEPQKETATATTTPDTPAGARAPTPTQDKLAEHQSAVPADPTAQHWATLVSQAAQHGFAVRTAYAGQSTIHAVDGIIEVAANQSPLNRIADLAELLASAAIHQAGIETTPAPDQPRNTPTVTTAIEWATASDTPIYDALRRELGLDAPTQPTPTPTRIAAALSPKPPRATPTKPGPTHDSERSGPARNNGTRAHDTAALARAR